VKPLYLFIAVIYRKSNVIWGTQEHNLGSHDRNI